MSKKTFFVLEKAPENNSVLSADGDFANVTVRGYLREDTEDDTFLPIAFSAEHIYLRVTNEESGALACPPVRLSIENDAFACELSLPVGGPYLMSVCVYDAEKGYFEKLHGACRRHFYVGDVYLIAGQSNAAGKAGGVLHESLELGVMLLRDLKHWDIASAPFSDYDDSLHNMFLHFAKIIKKETGRPIGLVPAAMGGAPLSRFLSEERGDLYRKMLGALEKHSVHPKAVLWYQGCSDSGCETERYLARFEKFVQNVRKDLQNDALNFYTFQLNRQIVTTESEDLDGRYETIREAQRLAAERISGVFVLPTIDGLSMSDFIHASRLSYTAYAERLAAKVLFCEYNKGLGVSVPAVASAEVRDTSLVITFMGVDSYLYDFHCGTRRLAISVFDEVGEIALISHSVKKNEIRIELSRKPGKETFFNLQCGKDPRNYIADFLSGTPALCAYRYPITQKEN